MTGTRIFLVRHGGIAGIPPGTFVGQSDPPLSAEGIARMKGVANFLAGASVSKVYTSPLARCRESAAIVARAFGVEPIAHEGLREVALGEWEGKTFPEIAGMYPAEAERMRREQVAFVYPGGESIERMAARAMRAWEEITFRSEGRTVTVVAHGGVNRAIISRLLEMPLPEMFRLHQDYGCVSAVDMAGRFPMLRLFNMTPRPADGED